MLRHSAMAHSAMAHSAMARSAIVLAALFTVGATAFAQQSNSDPSAPQVTVAGVRLDNGFRASKVIGAAVYNDQNQQVGTVSDLYLSKQNQVAMAIISVGSFLGIGGKLVSIPFDKLQIAEGKVVMPGGSKEELKGMPAVEYGG